MPAASGLAIDLLENVRLTVVPNRFASAQMTGSTVNYTFHSVEQVLGGLAEQYGTGTLMVKVVSPRPT